MKNFFQTCAITEARIVRFCESGDFAFFMLDNFNCVRALLYFDRFTN